MAPRTELDRSWLWWGMVLAGGCIALSSLTSCRSIASYRAENLAGKGLHAYDYLQARATETPLSRPCYDATLKLQKSTQELNQERKTAGSLVYQKRALLLDFQAVKKRCSERLP